MGSLREICRCVWVIVFISIVSANKQEKPRIYSLRVFTDIKFHFATTLVTSRVLNPSRTAREAVFDVTLPNQAFISNFTLEIGGKVYPGEVKEKAEAQKKYDQAKQRQQSAGHVKQTPRETNRFKVEINVGPDEKVTFNLTYQEVLERRLGVYEHMVYIDPGQPVEDLSVEVAIEENREITYLFVPPFRNDLLMEVDLTAPHEGVQVTRPTLNRAVIRYDPSPEVQTKDSASGLSGLFSVRYDVKRDLDGGDLLMVNGYFVHFFAPKVDNSVPKDVLFILDTSTSMSSNKLQQLKDAMRQILNDMTEGDKFNLMEFNSGVHEWKSEFVPVTQEKIKEAIKYVNRRRATGWTNMDEALQTGLDFLTNHNADGRNAMMIFLTDGVPTSGLTNGEDILRRAVSSNRNEVPIYGLAFGAGADWALVKKLAVQNNGVARRIYEDSDSSLQIEGFYNEVSTMLLTKVQAKYLDGTVDPDSLTTSIFKNYFNGSEIVIAGKLMDSTLRSLSVDMQAVDANGEITLSSTSNALDLSSVTASDLMDTEDLAVITEKMWAYLTLKQILKQQVGETNAQRKQELKSKAVAMSLKYGFVTPVTSMIVVKPEEEELSDLREDDSVLQDDADDNSQPAARQSKHRGSSGGGHRSAGRRQSGGGGGSSSRGGGGGDPHFMVELTTLPYPVCFDVDGDEGEVFRLLRDPAIDLTVNFELGKGLRKRDHPVKHGSIYRTFIFKVAIILNDVLAEVTRENIRLNTHNTSLYWNTPSSVRMPGVWIKMTEKGTLRFVLDAGMEVEVKRFVHPANNRLGTDFLQVEVFNEQHLSKRTDGVLGQFVHQKITMRNIVRKKHKTVAHLRSRTENGIRHGSAYLKQRKDPFFNRTMPCLNLHSKGLKLLDHPTSGYKVPHLLYI